MSTAEQRRAENIARNEAFLKNLGLDADKAKIESELLIKQVKRVKKEKKKSTEALLPTRRSSRLTVVSEKNDIEINKKNKSKDNNDNEDDEDNDDKIYYDREPEEKQELDEKT